MSGAYDFKNIPPLTETESRHPYAKFYYTPIRQPVPEVLAAIQPGTQIDPSLAVPITEYERTMRPDGLPCQNGYCVLPDGTGYSVVSIPLPGITDEMMAWWDTWFKSDDTHYKIWLPGLHVSHKTPLVEDLGWGMVEIERVWFVDLAKMGLSAAPQELDPLFFSHATSSNTAYLVGDRSKPSIHMTLVHQCTRTADGFMMRLVGWSGMHLLNGRVIRAIGENETVELEKVRLLACHNAYEFTRMGDLLPSLFEFSRTLQNARGLQS